VLFLKKLTSFVMASPHLFYNYIEYIDKKYMACPLHYNGVALFLWVATAFRSNMRKDRV